jgi:hypothetical protein
MKPLLRTILATPLISGVSMNMVVSPVSTLKAYGLCLGHNNSLATPAISPRIKLVSYANDLEVFLFFTEE